ncbi:proline-specific peptidase [Thozetella sp. PMI_491]|nr:proline-specific peptidase [Thozetella sp. PMI_491]
MDGATIQPITEGEVAFDWPPAGKPCKTWYKVVGDIATATQPTLITLHGGPGAGHEYMIPLADLWETRGIPVVLYDQVGCARSTRFPDKMGDGSFWSFNMFISELDNLIDHLGLRTRGFSLIGQSWGGEEPMIAALPEDVRLIIEDCLAKEDYTSEAFHKASDVFYARHFCRLDPFPEEIQQGFAHLTEDPTVYQTMTGPCEFVLTGSLKDWDGGRDVAHKIKVDTLLINGEHDEVSNLCIEPWFSGIQRVKWVTLAGASHMTHWEQRDRFLQLCANFLVD